MAYIRSIAGFALMGVVLLAGCGSPQPRVLSEQESPYASLVTGKRPLSPTQYLVRDGKEPGYSEDFIRHYEKVRGRALNVLLLSGGGQNGSFGAGLLKGWRAHGSRPEFDVVTGVSTGALLATHAFLGTPADDAVLEQLFTGVGADDIYRGRGLMDIVGGSSSLLDTDPLAKLIERTITPEVLERVAAEHAKGRRLVVGTTNLDYNQTWAWSLGAIAAAGGPEALTLYRKVLRASSAFPIMFPPVEIDGHLFADGAVRANLLVVGLSGDQPPGPPLYGRGTVYVVQNGKSDARPEAVGSDLVSIAGVGIGEMMSSSNESLVLRSYFAALVHEYDFQTISVPVDVEIGSDPLAFDRQQMMVGFQTGFELGKQGPAAWSSTPPLLQDLPPWALDVVRERL